MSLENPYRLTPFSVTRAFEVVQHKKEYFVNDAIEDLKAFEPNLAAYVSERLGVIPEPRYYRVAIAATFMVMRFHCELDKNTEPLLSEEIEVHEANKKDFLIQGEVCMGWYLAKLARATPAFDLYLGRFMKLLCLKTKLQRMTFQEGVVDASLPFISRREAWALEHRFPGFPDLAEVWRNGVG